MPRQKETLRASFLIMRGRAHPRVYAQVAAEAKPIAGARPAAENAEPTEKTVAGGRPAAEAKPAAGADLLQRSDHGGGMLAFMGLNNMDLNEKPREGTLKTRF